MTVSDNAIKVENLADFLKNLGKKRLNVSKKIEELWKLEQTLVLPLEALMQLYQHYLKRSTPIIRVEDFNWANLNKLCYKKGTKNRPTLGFCTTRD